MADHVIHLTVDGRADSSAVSPGETLLDVLRRSFNVMSCRESCGQGLCGTCTVSLDGRVVSSCLVLARLVDGAEVRTVASLADGGELGDLQAAFVETGALQCGFCTPGMLLTASELLSHHPDATPDDVRHYLAGNICRCGAYPEIVDAVCRVAVERRGVSR